MQLFLGVIIASSFFVIGKFIHDLQIRKKFYGEREFDLVRFDIYDNESKIRFFYDGKIANLKNHIPKLNDKLRGYSQTKEDLVDKFSTNYSDSTHFCKSQLNTKLDQIIALEPDILKNFIKILGDLVNFMHQDADDYNFLNRSADEYWEKHKQEKYIKMEDDWFQPELEKLLKIKYGEKILVEPNEVRGNTDLIYNSIPIECKVLKDKDGYSNSESGLKILENNKINQASQESIHVRCGILIAYDYRQENIPKDYSITSIIERIKFIINGQKIIALLVFLGRMEKPSKI
jgi:hypothetical protein